MDPDNVFEWICITYLLSPAPTLSYKSTEHNFSPAGWLWATQPHIYCLESAVKLTQSQHPATSIFTHVKEKGIYALVCPEDLSSWSGSDCQQYCRILRSPLWLLCLFSLGNSVYSLPHLRIVYFNFCFVFSVSSYQCWRKSRYLSKPPLVLLSVT